MLCLPGRVLAVARGLLPLRSLPAWVLCLDGHGDLVRAVRSGRLPDAAHGHRLLSLWRRLLPVLRRRQRVHRLRARPLPASRGGHVLPILRRRQLPVGRLVHVLQRLPCRDGARGFGAAHGLRVHPLHDGHVCVRQRVLCVCRMCSWDLSEHDGRFFFFVVVRGLRTRDLPAAGHGERLPSLSGWDFRYWRGHDGARGRVRLLVLTGHLQHWDGEQLRRCVSGVRGWAFLDRDGRDGPGILRVLPCWNLFCRDLLFLLHVLRGGRVLSRGLRSRHPVRGRLGVQRDAPGRPARVSARSCPRWK